MSCPWPYLPPNCSTTLGSFYQTPNYVLWPIAILSNLICTAISCACFYSLYKKGELFQLGIYQRVVWFLGIAHFCIIPVTVDILGFNGIIPRSIAIFLYSIPFWCLLNIGFISFQNSLFVLRHPVDQLLQITPSGSKAPLLFASTTFLLTMLLDSLSVFYSYELVSSVGLWMVRAVMGLYAVLGAAMLTKIFFSKSNNTQTMPINEPTQKLIARFFDIAAKIVLVFALIGVCQSVLPLSRYSHQVSLLAFMAAYGVIISFCGFTWVVVSYFGSNFGLKRPYLQATKLSKTKNFQTQGPQIVRSKLVENDIPEIVI